MTDTMNFGGLSRTLLVKGERVEVSIDELTWDECTLFQQMTGTEVTQAFAAMFNARLLLVVVWLLRRRTDDTLAWKTFADEVNPFRDLELVLPEPEPADAKAKRKAKPKGGDTAGEA